MNKQIILCALALLIVFTSCNDEDGLLDGTTIANSEVAPNDSDLTTATDITDAEYLLNDLEESVESSVLGRDPDDCPTITFSAPEGEFPNVMTIDFGDSCTTREGHVRSGKIIIAQSAEMSEDGATRTVTYDGYSFDGIVPTGTKVLTNLGTDDAGNSSFSRFVDMELIFPSGDTAQFNADLVKAQVAGGTTDTKADDAFETTGSVSGTNRVGNSFSAEITTPILRARTCRWPLSGVIAYERTTEDNGTVSRTVDYSYPNDGECDSLALVTLEDGSTKEIRICHK